MEIGEFLGAGLLIIVLLGIAALALIIYALVDLFRRPMDTPIKILWFVVIFFFPFLGALAYLLIGRSMRGTI